MGVLITLMLLTLMSLSNPAHADARFTLVLENGDHRHVSVISALEDGVLEYLMKNGTIRQQIDCARIEIIEQSHSLSFKKGGLIGVAGTLMGVVVGTIFPPVGIIGGAILLGTTCEVTYLSVNAGKKNVTGDYCEGAKKALRADTANPIQ
jgi:hypothetical protein